MTGHPGCQFSGVLLVHLRNHQLFQQIISPMIPRNVMSTPCRAQCSVFSYSTPTVLRRKIYCLYALLLFSPFLNLNCSIYHQFNWLSFITIAGGNIPNTQSCYSNNNLITVMHIWNDSNNNMVENILYEVVFHLFFIQHTEYLNVFTCSSGSLSSSTPCTISCTASFNTLTEEFALSSLLDIFCPF